MEAPIYSEEVQRKIARLRAALISESDRGLIVVGASSLEDELKELLISYFVFERSVRNIGSRRKDEYRIATKEAFRAAGSLGDFSAKNKLAFLLGLIQSEYDNLELLGRVRNKFAHRPEINSLSSNEVVDLMKRLLGSKKIDRQLVLNKMFSIASYIVARVLILQNPDFSQDMKRHLLKVAPPT